MPRELFEAIADADMDRLARLLSHGADANALREDAPFWRPLHEAIEQLEWGGDVEALVLLLRHGAAVDGWDVDHDTTPLLMALFRNQPEAVRILLAAGADPNCSGGEGDSPLRWCVERRDYDTASMLLRCGAHKSIDDAGGLGGMTALGRAASLLDVPMIQLLLRAGANPDAIDDDYRTARERMPPRDPDNAWTWDATEQLLLSGRARA